MNLLLHGIDDYLVDILAVRLEIKTRFEYDKDLLGSDYYQLMTTQGILGF